MHFAAPELLPFSVPTGMEGEPDTSSLHLVNEGPFTWEMTLFFPRDLRSTGGQHRSKALVGQLLPLMAKVP
jgi:hypothetical protein